MEGRALHDLWNVARLGNSNRRFSRRTSNQASGYKIGLRSDGLGFFLKGFKSTKLFRILDSEDNFLTIFNRIRIGRIKWFPEVLDRVDQVILIGQIKRFFEDLDPDRVDKVFSEGLDRADQLTSWRSIAGDFLRIRIGLIKWFSEYPDRADQMRIIWGSGSGGSGDFP